MPEYQRTEDGERLEYGPHHYVLAHVALRQVCFANPYGFFACMGADRRQPFLEDLWSKIRNNYDKDGPPPFSIKDVKITTTSINNFPFLLIHMPEPQKTPEAYFIGIVLKIQLTELDRPPEKPEVQYFTLERGIDLETKKVRTVFCEWQPEKHLYFGDGPEPNPGAFMEAIKRQI
jgi:hypothetical protein